ncbi:MAG: FAD binding domain-containing protein [Acidobacteriota bacterium]|nr:FAD binding domain-containing protein [Acidobacteriota bacterium]MDH3522363.1 FAD binding domain-containing protein [Acidobacteriota bacterium]
MLRLPPFELRQPTTLAEAADMLASEGPGARLVAGGTDLWPNMKRRHQQAATVISLMRIPGLREIGNGGGDLTLGATLSLHEVATHAAVRAAYPALAAAVESISSPPLRHMGTLGGNVCVDTRCTYYNQTEEWRRSIDYCLKEAGEICWVAPGSKRCLAHTAADSAPILCALGARVRLASAAGDREIPLTDLYRDDGIEYLAKRRDEIVTAILVPASAGAPRCRTAFWKLRRRGTIDFAVLSSSVALWLAPGGAIEAAEIYLGAVSSRPLRATAACDFLVGKRPLPDVLREAAELARKPATPFDNTDFQAQWRGVMVSRYTEAALREAAGLERQRMAPSHGLAAEPAGRRG